MVGKAIGKGSARDWTPYYRYTAQRPTRELLTQTLNHLQWEKRSRRGWTAIDLGSGAGNETLELLARGWKVLAVDQQRAAADFLARRVPARHRRSLTTLVAPLEGLELPSAHLVFASFSLPFCSPEAFPGLWRNIRRALRPGGHFAGQLFGDSDSWHGERTMTFHTRAEVLRLARGMKVELIREAEEDGMAFNGPKHWHYFDLILEQPSAAA